MLKFSLVIGASIVSIEKGNKIGTVKDIIFDGNTKKVLALLIRCKKIIYNHKIILVEDIVNAGVNTILVKNEEVLLPMEKLSEFKNAKKSWEDFIGTPVYSDGGVNIGEIQDAVFDWEMGSLEELEISDGIVQDLIQGRKIIPATESIQLEKGIVMIDNQDIRHLKHTGKGIKRILAEGSNEDEKE